MRIGAPAEQGPWPAKYFSRAGALACIALSALGQSSVDEAEVTIMRFISSSIGTPKYRATATGASPVKAWSLAKMPTYLCRTSH